MLLSLADVAMGAATFAAGGGHPCATIQLESQFVTAAKHGQRLVALATQLRRTRELSFMQCEIWGGGRQVMRASGVWKYLSSRAPASGGEGSAT
jgi:acyl-coenzyme A thioesterase PaaI-like protein